MDKRPTGILAVHINFEQSQLYFPRIIVAILILLLLIIIIRGVVERRRARQRGERRERFHFFERDYDKLKLYGTVALSVAYLFAMFYVGQLFPNEGFGFLFTSIPYMLLLSMLFSGRARIRKRLIPIVLSSILTPLIVWEVLGQLFNISLP